LATLRPLGLTIPIWTSSRLPARENSKSTASGLYWKITPVTSTSSGLAMVDRAGLVDYTSGYNMPWALEKEAYTR
jgi:hypothetical protein